MDVDSSSKSGINSMMPLAIGILGVLVGGVALLMSFSNSSKLTAQRTDIDAATQAANDAKTAAAAAGSLSAKLDATSSKLDAFIAEAQNVLTKYSQAITADDAKITELSDSIAKIGKGSAPATRGGGQTASNVVAGQGGTHTIASGDTFSTLARRYNVTLKAIEDANPGVDSSKLRVGQVITIPASHSSSGSSAPAPRSVAPADTGSSAPAPASAVSTS
jgi:LysM repeat protein